MTTQNVKPRWSLTEGGCLQETYPMLNMFYSCKKAIFRKKITQVLRIRYTVLRKISVPCTIQECDNDTTSYYLIFTLFSVKWSLTRGFTSIQLQSELYKKWLQGISNVLIWLGNLLVWKTCHCRRGGWLY